MTSNKVTRNVYCTDPEDRVIPTSCPCCSKCWMFIASKGGTKNGICVFGGPFTGFTQCESTTAPSS